MSWKEVKKKKNPTVTYVNMNERSIETDKNEEIDKEKTRSVERYHKYRFMHGTKHN